MPKKKLKIHSENILPIIKKWLYSDKDIFLRELVSNACDAIAKTKVVRDQEQLNIKDEEFRIDITIDKDNKTMTFTDTGIGMTSEEVDKYIAQLAFSGAEEFVKKYETKNENDQIIGHFGLGFYSAFMVAKEVTIDTLSYKEGEKAAFWACDGSSDYTLKASKKESRGTEITLHLNDSEEEFLDENKVRAILTKYCKFLPHPIYLNERKINEKEPLWVKNPSECSDEDYLAFFRYLYPTEPEPMFWIHLNVDYPFHLKGILYFPKITKGIEFSKSYLQLYCNRVFVSDNCKDLIPEYLTILKGIIDSPDIPLNVSRSSLQMDRTVRQLSSHIAKKITDKLQKLYNNDFEKYSNIWKDIEMIVKLGCLQDDKFYERAKDLIVWKTTQDRHATLSDYMETAKEKHENKVFYTFDENHTSHFLEMYMQKDIEVLFAHHYLDPPLFGMLEGKTPNLSFQRIDGGVDDNIIDKESEKTVLDADGKTEASKMADAIESLLSGDGKLKVEAKSLANETLPAFVMIDEQSRRMRDAFSMADQSATMPFPDGKTFVINTNSKLIKAIIDLKSKDTSLASELANQVYDLSLLQQKELDPKEFANFLKRSSNLLEELASQV